MRRVTHAGLLEAYDLTDRNLYAVVETADTVTLRFDLHHCDDAERDRDGTEYLFDISIPRTGFAIRIGADNDLGGGFGSDILEAAIEGDVLRLVADCSFHGPLRHDVVELALSGGEVVVGVRAPAPVSSRP